MLGGSVVIALIRYVISVAGVAILFFLMSELRFGRKKALAYYGMFSAALIGAACIWYMADWESCAKMSAFTMYMCFAVFSIFMSSDPVFLSVYKLALTFYLLAVFLISGIEVSSIFFHGNVWADIVVRILLILAMSLFINYKIKDSIRGFGQYVESELDRFSVAVMVISILFGIGFIMNSNILREQTPFRLFQIATNLFLTGALQLLVFRLYLHIGKEREYQREKQLVEMNHRLLERNVELMEESVEEGRQIRHDARHHNAVIAEYARRGQNGEILQYLKEYEKEMDAGIPEAICANMAVNNLLAALELGKDLEIPSISLVAILANAYENAIFGCMEVKKQSKGRECFISLMIKKKNNKLVISCKNTCRMETMVKNGQPKPEFTGGIGVLSIIKTAEKFDGEYDFRNDNGVFVFRLILKIPVVDDDMRAP